jgi:hypothetical protein
VYAPYVEHVPPDVTACIFWLKNRDPQHWRDSQPTTNAAQQTLTPSSADGLFLSSTPHNGHSFSFSTLLELLDPYRFTRGVKVRGKRALEDVMVRRLKENIRSVQGGFPIRKVKPVVIDRLPEDAPELTLSRLLDQCRTAREDRSQALQVGLRQQRDCSVFCQAFARSLKVHRATVERQWDKGVQLIPGGPHNQER